MSPYIELFPFGSRAIVYDNKQQTVSMRVLDVDSGKYIHDFDYDFSNHHICFSSSSKYMIFSNHRDLSVFDINTYERLFIVDMTILSPFGISYDDKYLVYFNHDDNNIMSLFVIDIELRKQIYTYKIHKLPYVEKLIIWNTKIVFQYDRTITVIDFVNDTIESLFDGICETFDLHSSGLMLVIDETHTHTFMNMKTNTILSNTKHVHVNEPIDVKISPCGTRYIYREKDYNNQVYWHLNDSNTVYKDFDKFSKCGNYIYTRNTIFGNWKYDKPVSCLSKTDEWDKYQINDEYVLDVNMKNGLVVSVYKQNKKSIEDLINNKLKAYVPGVCRLIADYAIEWKYKHKLDV